jgi:hypothetical protein
MPANRTRPAFSRLPSRPPDRLWFPSQPSKRATEAPVTAASKATRFRSGFACSSAGSMPASPTLTNALVGQKIVIASSRPQERRRCVLRLIARCSSLRIAPETARHRLPTKSVSLAPPQHGGPRSDVGDADGGKFAMFAPPFGRGDAGATLFPFRQLRRRRRQLSEHRGARSKQPNRARCPSGCSQWTH